MFNITGLIKLHTKYRAYQSYHIQQNVILVSVLNVQEVISSIFPVIKSKTTSVIYHRRERFSIEIQKTHNASSKRGRTMINYLYAVSLFADKEQDYIWTAAEHCAGTLSTKYCFETMFNYISSFKSKLTQYMI